MDFEWDRGKAASNLRKHGIDFADAVGVFDDLGALARADDCPDEARHVALGCDPLGRALVVVYALAGISPFTSSRRQEVSTSRRGAVLFFRSRAPKGRPVIHL